jgi:hypothetical protein
MSDIYSKYHPKFSSTLQSIHRRAIDHREDSMVGLFGEANLCVQSVSQINILSSVEKAIKSMWNRGWIVRSSDRQKYELCAIP